MQHFISPQKSRVFITIGVQVRSRLGKSRCAGWTRRNTGQRALFLDDWKNSILNYFIHRVTIGVIEGINNLIIKVIYRIHKNVIKIA
ncbi:MAG: transposase [Candidatus Competibacteraceae bacterium]|nr:transposase [Candidatus Competibacteraceae bacterium]